MKRQIFFCADDFGHSPAANEAIVRAHRSGALHGASLMLGQPATAEAVELARQHPRLQIGWHLHLCDSVPLTRREWPWDTSPSRAGWNIGLFAKARCLMHREIEAQWQAFCRTGLPCAFVNCHHHLQAHPMVLAAMLSVLPPNYSGWIRLGRPRFFSENFATRIKHLPLALWFSGGRTRCRFQMSGTLWGLDRLFCMNPREIESAVSQLHEGLHEFMFHPRSLENDADMACLAELRAAVFANAIEAA